MQRFFCRNNSLGVVFVVACGVERYVSRNCDNRVLNDGSSFCPAFIARLKVCTNLSARPFEEGWYGALCMPFTLMN